MDNRDKNRALVAFLLLPTAFLTAALLGGLRVGPDGGFVFVAPPLVTLVLAVLLMLLFVRGRLIEAGRGVSSPRPPL